MLAAQECLPRIEPEHNGSLAAWCQLAAACAERPPSAEALQHCARVCSSWGVHFPRAPASVFVGPLIAAASASETPDGSAAQPSAGGPPAAAARPAAAMRVLDRILEPGNAAGVQRDLQGLHDQAEALAAAAAGAPAATVDPAAVPLLMACRLLQPPLPALQVGLCHTFECAGILCVRQVSFHCAAVLHPAQLSMCCAAALVLRSAVTLHLILHACADGGRTNPRAWDGIHVALSSASWEPFRQPAGLVALLSVIGLRHCIALPAAHTASCRRCVSSIEVCAPLQRLTPVGALRRSWARSFPGCWGAWTLRAWQP